MQPIKTSSITETALIIEKQAANCARFIVAIAGAPGSGKSTLAVELQAAFSLISPLLSCQIVPMDGFHFDNKTLIKCQQLKFKGAPYTFDVNAITAFVKQLKNQKNTLLAPLFNRDLEEVIPSAIPIKVETKIIIVEGNYLLLQQPPWDQLLSDFDFSLFIQTDKAILEQRLINRWLDQGLNLASAQDKTRQNDLVNGELVSQFSSTPNIIFKQ
jgi:pantothenate kinase